MRCWVIARCIFLLRNCDRGPRWTTQPATLPRIVTAWLSAATAACSVMSVSQCRFGASAVKSRRARSS
jgi:hypothetical protein